MEANPIVSQLSIGIFLICIGLGSTVSTSVNGTAAIIVLNTEYRIYTYKTNVGILEKIEHAAADGFFGGADYDGTFFYWTKNTDFDSTIVRLRNENDSHPQPIITTGYKYLPEDITVDWISHNIYFTNILSNNIGVCSSDGKSCIIVVGAVNPKYITLNPLNRVLYWAEMEGESVVRIKSAGMDGSNPVLVCPLSGFIKDLTFDFDNDRVYWISHFEDNIESIKLSSSQYQLVLDKEKYVRKYGLAIFQDRLYWSWFNTEHLELKINSCNKFSCVNDSVHASVAYETSLKGMRLFDYSVLQRNVSNPCEGAPCSDMCLLTPNDPGFSCVCREGSVLNDDLVTCRAANDTDFLFVSAGQTLIRIKLLAFSNFSFTHIPLPTIRNIGPITYDYLQGKVILYDTVQKKIFSYEPNTNHLDVILDKGVENMTSMDYDIMAGNLYWADSEKRTIEVMSLKTLKRMTLKRNLGDVPVQILVVPEENAFFLASFGETFHIDLLYMNGISRGGNPVVEVSSHVVKPPFSMAYDYYKSFIFWTDRNHIGNQHSGIYRSYKRNSTHELDKPASSTIILDNHFFWIHRSSNHVQWMKTFDLGKSLFFTSSRKKLLKTASKDFDIGLSGDIVHPYLAAVSMERKLTTHLCQNNNGNCSHVCLALSDSAECGCPDGESLQPDGLTCGNRLASVPQNSSIV